MVRSKSNQCESWLHSVVVEIGSIQVVVKTLVLRELAPSAHPFQRVAITQQSIWRRWKYFPRTSLSQIPLASRQKSHFVQF